VQRVTDLLRAIKKSVDDDRRAGRFLLTGSANILTLPQVSESLAGRMEIVSLLPLSRAEIAGAVIGIVASLRRAVQIRPLNFWFRAAKGELLGSILTSGRMHQPDRRLPFWQTECK
jgi:predicted AAA+ superfamily ATPase